MGWPGGPLGGGPERHRQPLGPPGESPSVRGHTATAIRRQPPGGKENIQRVRLAGLGKSPRSGHSPCAGSRYRLRVRSTYLSPPDFQVKSRSSRGVVVHATCDGAPSTIPALRMDLPGQGELEGAGGSRSKVATACAWRGTAPKRQPHKQEHSPPPAAKTSGLGCRRHRGLPTLRGAGRVSRRWQGMCGTSVFRGSGGPQAPSCAKAAFP